MEIHEYQAKQLLRDFGVDVPLGGLAYSPEQAVYRANELSGSQWIVKAQIHSGGRGRAGGVKLCRSTQEIWDASESLLGRKLVTNQTGPAGKTVYRLYVESAYNLLDEMYFALVLDRSRECIVAIGAAQGGVDIEEVSECQPDSIVRIEIEPAVGMQMFQARRLAYRIGFEAQDASQAANIFLRAYRAFRDLDATMLEINPLARTSEGGVLALDAKMTFDDNALYRHSLIAEFRDKTQEDPNEMEAADRGLNYVGLEGNIGCIVNGAGLAMATMDIVKLKGGEPANFMDIGGGASPSRVAKAFRLVQSDSKVQAVLVNIFAGINRCDWVAQGVIEAVERFKPQIPVVVRLAGTHMEEGLRMIRESGLQIKSTDRLDTAVKTVVESIEGER